MDREYAVLGRYYRLSPAEVERVEQVNPDILLHKMFKQPDNGDTILYMSIKSAASINEIESLGLTINNRKVQS